LTDNRRSSTRHTVSIETQVTVEGTPRDVMMINLSLGGALLQDDTRYKMGQRVQLRFRIPTQEDPVEVGATVRWSDANGVGLQFDGLRARDVWALNEFFKQLGS